MNIERSPGVVGRIDLTAYCLALALLVAGNCPCQDLPPMPLYSFGVIADVQYADQPNSGARHYRTSLQRLEVCVTELNKRDLKFVVQLGDFIDKGKTSFDAVLPHWKRLRTRKFHVIGNHDLPAMRSQTMKKLGLARSYYDFTVGDHWRFVVVDGMDVSLYGYPRGHPNRKQATQMLQALKAKKAPNAVIWNGGVGKEQLAWIRRVLKDAARQQQRVVFFCHFPIHPKAGGAGLLLWNHRQVTDLMDEFPCVAAWFNGHHHTGGYAHIKGVHHVTFMGMVEAPKRNAYAVLDVFESRLVLNGVGKQPSRTLQLR
ncbi:MAG: metallophosphoesterase [Planctomycetota bacterium]|nr:metallophosphoesterase [Planctomycetota bacterium]